MYITRLWNVHVYHKIIECSSQDYRMYMYIIGYRMFVTRLYNVYHKIIECTSI